MVDAPVMLRLPFIALFAATTWIIYRLTAAHFGERAGWYAALLLTLAPVFTVSTGSWMLPDGPLMFGQALAALALTHIVFDADEPASRWWIAFVAGAAVAVLSKYHAVLFFAGVVLWCATSAGARRWLRRREPYIATLVIALAGVPVLAWNVEHQWASVRFQIFRASGHHGSGLVALAQNIGGQIGYLLPWIWLPLVIGLAIAVRRGPRDERRWLFVCLASPPIVLFTLAALGGSPGLPHWPAPGYLFAVPLGAAWLDALARRRGARLLRAALALAAVGLIVPIALIASQARTGWITRAEPRWFARGDPSLDLLDWRALSGNEVIIHMLRSGTPVFASNWIDAAKLSYGLGRGAVVRCACGDARHFQFLPPVRAGGDTLLVVRANAAGAPSAANAQTLGATRVGTIAVLRAGRPALYLTALRLSSPRR